MKKNITDNYSLLLGDNIQLMKTIEDNSIHSVVTDPPYALTSIVKRFGKSNSADAQYGTDGVFKRSSKGFMGKEWDSDVPSVEFWREVYRILKPGGHILSFGGTRTYHRMATAIEDAGFEIRDQLQWIYATGFAKSHNIGKAIDSQIKTGKSNPKSINECELDKTDGRIIKTSQPNNGILGQKKNITKKIGASLESESAKKWQGWGTGLKPANEPICLARKPLSERTIAENVLKQGTGGINIDDCRIGNEVRTTPIHSDDVKDDNTLFGLHKTIQLERVETTEGRFPANIMFDEEAGKILGEPSRFFYCPKVSKKERNMGLETFEEKQRSGQSDNGLYSSSPYCIDCGKTINGTNDHANCQEGLEYIPSTKTTKNIHPTVKPIQLMSYLVKLITPIGGTVLDPFMGSGSGGIATLLEGFNFVGMEQDPEYFEIATARVKEYESYREILIKPKKTKREIVIVEKDLEIGEPVSSFWLNQVV